MAGLLTARILADAFTDVTVIDRDSFPDEPAPRRGVPQGNHVHSLWESGRATLEDLFPGFSEDLRAAGGVKTELGRDFKIFLQGDFMAPGTDRHLMYFATRPVFEHLVRQYVSGLDRVHIRSQCQFIEYLVDDEATTIESVRIRNRESEIEELAAEIVVDATGRTSRTPAWLEAHGYRLPPLEEIRIDLAYASTFIERPPDDTRAFAVDAESPHTRGAFVHPVEGNRWLVSLYGRHGDHPPADATGFKEFTASLPTPVVEELLDEHPIVAKDVIRYPFPANRRYRYEELDRFPTGLIVIGDAIASYNPTNGQGMSVAALQALVLHHALATGNRTEMGLRFFTDAAEISGAAWDLTVSGDLEFPQTEGPRPRGTAVLNWYLNRMFRRAHTDSQLSDVVFLVFSLQQPSSELFRPQVIWRVVGPSHGARVSQTQKPPRGQAT
jgi:2-polyprenyl-6-methoxyphenol hydroxylase-like FAD-dependent oxidoreductase